MAVKIPSFFRLLAAEIRRRKVLRVVAIYAVTAWLVLQVVQTVFEPLGFPSWSMRVTILVAIVGFPISFLLAWIIDVRPAGLFFDLPLWVGDSDHPRPHRKTDLIYAALLGLLLCGGTYSFVARLLDDAVPESNTMAFGGAPPNSIAVLAFENFGAQADVDYFAAGLSEEILNLLASISELNVASRTSSFQFRGKQIGIHDVAKLLKVRHILEGSARQDGESIQVTARLINGESGYHDWIDTYKRPLDDIFSVQQEIAAAVVNELKIAMSVDFEAELQYKPTDNIDAYVYYLEGRGRLRSSLDADAMATASQLFQKALDIDPEFSRAHAGICEAHLRLYDITSSPDDFDTAENACGKASKFDPGLNSEINLALGKLYRYRGWYERAEAQLNNAIAIDSTAVDAYIELGQIRAAQEKRVEAEAYYLRALDLKRNYWRAHEALASFYYRTERYEEAATAYELATSLAPDVASAFGGKGATYWMLGDMEKARVAYDESLRIKPSRQGYTNLGSRYYYAGQYSDAIKMQEKALEFAPDDHRVWGRLAESYRLTGDNEAESREAYVNAARHAEDKLRINSEDWKTAGLLGIYYAYSGRPDDAMRLVDSSVSTSQGNSEALYFKGLVLLKSGDRISAINALEKSVAADARYAQFMETDPDLQTLRDDRRFLSLLPKNVE